MRDNHANAGPATQRRDDSAHAPIPGGETRHSRSERDGDVRRSPAADEDANASRHNVAFISWAPFCSRSDSIASHLDGESFMVYAKRYGSRYLTVPFKYLSQTLTTLRLLFRRKPRAVFVMTPPVTACFAVWVYSRIAGVPFVIDAHSAAFLHPRWRHLLFVHKWFSRAARTTIVTNEHLRDIIRRWGASATIVRDVPVRFAEPVRPRLAGACNMTLVCTFTPDEPIELFLRAAARLPDINFYVTGNHSRADPHVLAVRPENVTLTGFLSDGEYVGLLLTSDAVICLTTREHTMQRGAYEAMYLRRPIITSNTDLLRRHFFKGSVHVDNTIEGLVAGIARMRDNLARFSAEIDDLRSERLGDWERVENELRTIIAGQP